MTAIKRFGAAAITMVAIGALAIPSSALAGKSHHLKLYKVEKHIDVEGDLEYTVSCKPGDIATDGMWRVDDVSQDNEFDSLGQWTQTVATKSTTVAGNTEDYVFAFLPIAGGDVQVKLWVTCLENPAGPGGNHGHPFLTKRVSGTSAPQLAPNGSVTYTMYPDATGNVTGTPAPAGGCPTGQWVPIAPGFDMTAAGHQGYGYLQENWHAPAAANIGWKWRFNVVAADNPPATENFRADLSFRCLKLKSDPNTGPSPAPHSHRIIQQYKSKMNINHVFRSFDTHQQHCGEHYKGMVGMWNSHHNDLYYLGMDPRIKSRAFKFVNVGLADHTLDIKLSCFKDRTS